MAFYDKDYFILFYDANDSAVKTEEKFSKCEIADYNRHYQPLHMP